MEELHVKYRPTTFDEVVGHEEVVKSIKQVLAGKSARAFLFVGDSGTGKTTLGRIIAKELGAEPANIIEVDAATFTGVDSVRQITEGLTYQAFGGNGIRVIIYDEVHAASKAAFQSLLKSIEEPPEGVYWVLCTTEAAKIPKTIKTRCVSYTLSPLSDDLIFEHLAQIAELEGFSVSDAVLDQIADEANGSMRQALVFLSTCADVTDVKTASKLIGTVAGTDVALDLCRWLAKGQNITWKKAVIYLNKLQEEPAESIRLQVRAYISKVLLGLKNPDKLPYLLHVLDVFNEPFQYGDNLTPLVLALGRVVCGEED